MSIYIYFFFFVVWLPEVGGSSSKTSSVLWVSLQAEVGLTGSQWRFWCWRGAFECLVRFSFHPLPARVILKKKRLQVRVVFFPRCFCGCVCSSARLQQQRFSGKIVSSCMAPKRSRPKNVYRSDDEGLFCCKELKTYVGTFSICR